MLCMNCHHEVEEGTTKIPESIKRFDKELAIRVRERKNIEEKRHVCVICASTFLSSAHNAKYCCKACKLQARREQRLLSKA